MALKRAKCDLNGINIKTAIFFKALQKIAHGWGLRSKILIIYSGRGLCPQIPVCDTFYLH